MAKNCAASDQCSRTPKDFQCSVTDVVSSNGNIRSAG